MPCETRVQSRLAATFVSVWIPGKSQYRIVNYRQGAVLYASSSSSPYDLRFMLFSAYLLSPPQVLPTAIAFTFTLTLTF